MSVLLTPPNSSHRTDKEKENKYPAPVAGSSTRTVVWAPENSIHCLGTPPKLTTISSRSRPKVSKSILKKTSQTNLLAVPVPTKQREVTPEPKDPLVNLDYLDRPVNQIISNDSPDEASLRQLIEGYNVLAARVRTCVTDSTGADASWPLFQPLRKNADAFVDAVVRDLGRALVDPLVHRNQAEEGDALGAPKFTLPSPQKSPMKKRGGMTAEQVKYARDVCTTCQSVIRLLSAILSIKAVYSVFEEKQLGRILTALLAIPMAEELPTPNARKTCALAIWLIQVQRLPATVLQPAADRIAYALRRGLDGELGKEGKKGSVSDGLKAIHDLSVYLPDIFVPAFTQLLPSILCNLLANTFNLRTQACHALGGFILGSISLPLCPVHTKIASIISTFITTVAPPDAKSPRSPKSPPRIPEATIVRTLRTTLICVDPTHVAQGPVWGFSVLASFVVGLRSRLCEDAKVNRILSTLLSLGMRHKKSSVRALCCITWRPVTWVYFQPPLPVDSDEGEEEVDKEAVSTITPAQVRGVHLKVMKSVVEMQAGVSAIAAFLAEKNGSTDDEALQHVLEILQTMATKPGPTCKETEETLRHLTSLPNSSREKVGPWDFNLLLPKSLFSSSPGLLTADYKNMRNAVQELYEQVAMIHDIRYLTAEEMSKPWVFSGLLAAWRITLGRLEMFDETEVPENLVETWSNLLKANVSVRQENDGEHEIIQFAYSAVLYLVDIANDPSLDLRPLKVTDILAAGTSDVPGGSDDTVPDIDGPATLTNAELRMRVIHRLWGVMKIIIPHDLLVRAAEKLLDGLVENWELLVPECSRLDGSSNDDDLESPRNSWISLCMDVLSLCHPETFKLFWCCETDAVENLSRWRWTGEFTRAIWKMSVDMFMDGGDRWQDGIVLLGVPFSDRHAWNHSSEDYNSWEDLLSSTSSKALDDGVELIQILDRLASFVSNFQTPGLHPSPSTRLVDFMFSNINAGDMSDLPLQVLELASSTLRATYPPEPRNKQVGMWMVRSIANVIEHCPVELSLSLLQAMEDSLCLWLADECQTWSEDELNYDVIPLYQHILVRIQALPESLETLKAVESILNSVFTKKALPSAVEAFKDYWNLTYSRVPEPEDGWSDTVTHCLRATGILPPLVSIESTSTSPLAPAFVLPLPAPETPTCSSFTTPSTAFTKVSSPERPQKVFPTFPILPSTPLSPVRQRRRSSSSTNRTPLSAIQLCNSSIKRRRLMSDGESDMEKENQVSYGPLSVTKRIAGLKVNGKKRQLEEDDELPEPTPTKKLKSKMKPRNKPPAKKMRATSPAPSTVSSNESEDERWVESTLVSELSFPKKGTTPASLEESRFRTYARRPRGSSFNSLETPTPPTGLMLKEKNHTPNLDRLATPVKKIDFTKVQIRRSSSIPESLLAFVANRKRKRTVSFPGSDDEENHEFDPPAQTLRPLAARPRRHLKRAYTIPSSDSDISVPPMSSDDDPHLGQVTPHHVVSPVLSRRSISELASSSLSATKGLFGDSPESDGSVASESDSESPTKEFVSRQLQRMGSESKFSKILPIPT